MVDRVGGFRRKTRYKFRKNVRSRGKLSQRKYFQTFENGEKVILGADASYQQGMYFPRFHGKVGVVGKQVGRCYEVKIKDFNKEKNLIIHPVHLSKLAKV
ncbi:MAG: 50S ribosomal protein L21e [Nanobdellota archaeon]